MNKKTNHPRGSPLRARLRATVKVPRQNARRMVSPTTPVLSSSSRKPLWADGAPETSLDPSWARLMGLQKAAKPAAHPWMLPDLLDHGLPERNPPCQVLGGLDVSPGQVRNERPEDGLKDVFGVVDVRADADHEQTSRPVAPGP